MERTIKAKFRKGVIEPLEKLDIEEGKEILVAIKELPLEDRFEKAAGSWKDLVDCEQLLEDIHESRRLSQKRSAVKL